MKSFRFSSVFFFFFFILFIVAVNAEDSNAEEDSTDLQAAVVCRYILRVKTGNVTNAGTDSGISLKLGNGPESSFNIPSLRSWGVMVPGYDYFENGNLDFFVGRGLCLPSKVCRITVTSDGTGIHPGWYLEYVDITIIRPSIPNERILFPVNQWLSISSAPYQLCTTRNKCVISEGGVEAGLDIAKV